MPSKFHFFTEPTKLASQSVNQSFMESTGEIGTGYSIAKHINSPGKTMGY